MRDDEQKSRLMPVVIVAGFLGFLAIVFAIVVLPILYLEDGGRTPVARAMSEMRNLAVNLETYYVDHNTYPPAVDNEGNTILFGASGKVVSAGFVPWMLTTPIAYTSVLPDDPFVRPGFYPVSTYRFATNGESCWILLSDGPDQDEDIVAAHFPSPATGNCDRTVFLSQFGGPAIEYDSTNGIGSSGDIIRVGP